MGSIPRLGIELASHSARSRPLRDVPLGSPRRCSDHEASESGPILGGIVTTSPAMGMANLPCQGYYGGVLHPGGQVEEAVDLIHLISEGGGSHPLRHLSV